MRVAVTSMSMCRCFFFKQKTAYEIRPRDWSSDVCSSDLGVAPAIVRSARLGSCAMTRPRFTNCGSVIPRSMNLRVCSLTPAIAMRPIFIGGSFLSENLTKKNEGHAGYDRGFVHAADRRAQRAVVRAGEIPQQRRVEGVQPHDETGCRAGGVRQIG